LVEKADILVEGFRPGVMERLKTDYPTLKKMNPGLIYCSLTGFGHDGPYAKVPAHDSNFIGLGGALGLIGERDGRPYLPSNYVADMAGAGLHGAIGILTAIIARGKTGKGQFVDVAYLDGVISILAGDASLYFRTGEAPRRGETPITGGTPWANAYRCKDGEYIVTGCAEPHLWANLCRSLGREDLLQYQNPPPEERDGILAELEKIFLTKTRDEWVAFFEGKEAAVSPVLYLNETFDNPQVIHRKMVVEIDHPRLGKVKQIGIPIKLSETPGEIRSLGVVANENTEEILLSLGYTDEQIEAMRKDGSVD
jgi:crotonobetainyl-CoA:carnitine CoA-transferase CaiB-like acyl-CoA transferase